jgi:hypothetical protein
MSGWQLSGDAPTAYTRYAPHILAPWTDDLIAQSDCAALFHHLPKNVTLKSSRADYAT